jgi:hypothetical protein
MFHMGSARDWADIGYSFGVCPHYVLEGRGKDRAQAAQPGGNSTWYSCTFMTGPGEQIHPGQIQNFRELRAWLMSDDVAAAIRPHSSFVTTGCPGDVLRDMINNGSLTTGAVPVDLEELMFCERNDSGMVVKHWQVKLRDLKYYMSEIDGVYGPNMASAVLSARMEAGSDATNGDKIEAYAKKQIDLLWTRWAVQGDTSYTQLQKRSDSQNTRILDVERMHYPPDKENAAPHVPEIVVGSGDDNGVGDVPALPDSFQITGTVTGTLKLEES